MKKFLSPGKLLIYRNKSTWTGWDNEEITVYKDNKGNFFLKGRPHREQKYPDFTTNTNVIKRVSVPKEWIMNIFERLAASRISAYPMPDMGEDGSFTELEIGGYCGKSHYRWWGDAPESWELLEEIANEIYDKFYSNKK